MALLEEMEVLGREFELSQREFRLLASLATEHAGIVLGDHKRNMVYSRLSRRLRALGLSNFSDYCALVGDPDSAEFPQFINAITTNLTSFFRESHHFDHLREIVVPGVIAANPPDRVIRIWSAGCSTGEEPYSIAMTVLDALSRESGWKLQLLATDLDTNVLAAAAAGIYEEERIRELAPELRKQWFQRGTGQNQGKVRVVPELRECIQFQQFNLIESWGAKGPFDAIFCRNVMIYFRKETRQELFGRFAQALDRKAYLYIGHSETLQQTTSSFVPLGRTIYRKMQ